MRGERLLIWMNLINLLLILLVACSTRPEFEKKNLSGKPHYIFTERLIKGKDTGMISLTGFKRVRLADILCQHWELKNMEDISSIELVMEPVTNIRIFPDLALFKDSSVVENARNKIRIGKWTTKGTRQPVLTLVFEKAAIKEYTITELTSSSLLLTSKGKKDSLYLRLSSDAKVHENMRNDPFYPDNMLWRLRPDNPEKDSAIRERVKQCIWFYALYFRDCIKRKKESINFLGLPMIFKWYSGGIGLPDKTKLHESWIACFYNRKQAMRGYELLRDLITENEFNWEKGAPDWIYQTHSVLEQMYQKLNP